MKLEWSDTYSIGNTQLDAQHKKWIELYNRLDRVLSGEENEELSELKKKVLQEMYHYVEYHFNFEEEYMRDIDYPEIERHWRMPNDFRHRIYQLSRENQEGGIVLNTEVLDLLRGWILYHIVTQDVKVMHFLQSQKSLKSSTQ